ncbi:MAG: undecaprenyl/decaprenyl-phosphate alpha-N-acetylglucosaminyl 1-phosphate transferase [Caldilineaceae bacterium]|nr:undecaprenyl/decaprenyl-phosphate alpha-N-acetylglucosaminyl 1-phosphate transferase [Caldilineaceae bacterium]
MTPFLLMAASALLLAVVGTPLVRRFAIHFGVLDAPAERKIHAQPVPLLGGAAIYIAFIVVLAIMGDRRHINEVVGIFIGATLISLMGVADDRWGVSSYMKLGGQVIAAGVLVVSGVQVQLFGNWLDVLITVVWVVGITNAMNLLDNMDGLSAGIGMIAAVYFTLLAAMSDQYFVGALAAALAGACAGFLIYNWNPAHIFMGDTGSLFIGFLLAAVGIKLRFPSNSHTITWMIPLLVLAVPIFDTTLVFFSRLRRGQNPLTTPGKDHLSHRLARMTGSRREAVLLCYLIAGASGLAAIFLTQATTLEAIVVGGVFLLASSICLLWLEFGSAAKHEQATLGHEVMK